MNCDQLRHRIEATGFQRDESAKVHIEKCELCRTWFDDARLRAALQRDPVPEPSPGFEDRVIARAVRQGGAPGVRDRNRFAALAAALSIAATGLIGWFAMSAREHLPEASGPRIVKVVIEAKDHRDDALLTPDLSGGLQLEGFGEQRHIEWRTDLVKGRNLLALPVNVKPGGHGDLRVALSYDGEPRTEMRVTVGT